MNAVITKANYDRDGTMVRPSIDPLQNSRLFIYRSSGGSTLGPGEGGTGPSISWLGPKFSHTLDTVVN